MAVTATAYGKFATNLGLARHDFSADNIYVLLTGSGYTPNKDTHETLSDITSELAATGNYTTGGQQLTGVAWTYDAANDRVGLIADNVTWTAATFTAYKAVIYKHTGTAGTSYLISWVDFGAGQTASGVDFVIQWDATGVVRLTAL